MGIKLPKSLNKIAQDPRLLEAWREWDDPMFRSGGYSYWLYLAPGWCNGDADTHIIHERTVNAVLSEWTRVKMCACSACKKAED